MKELLESDSAKKVLAIFAIMLGGIAVQYQGQTAGTVAGFALAVLTAAGIVSGGTAGAQPKLPPAAPEDERMVILPLPPSQPKEPPFVLDEAKVVQVP